MGRPLRTAKTVCINVPMTVPFLGLVTDYQRSLGLNSRADAIRTLIMIGLSIAPQTDHTVAHQQAEDLMSREA